MTENNLPPPPPPYPGPGVPPPMTPLGYPAPVVPQAPRGTNTWKVVTIVLVCLLAVGVVLCGCMVSILLPSLNRAREMANRVKCASNLRQIGISVQMYANEHGGQFPDTLERVMVAADLDPITLVCPSSKDTPAPGANAQARAANVSKGGHLSYVYVGKGMNSSSGPGTRSATVVAYEPMTNHGNDGINVLFASGEVTYVKNPQAKQIIAALQAGKNPPGVGGL